MIEKCSLLPKKGPRLWGKERDARLRKMRFKTGKCKLKLDQSSIDVAPWIIIEDKEEEFDHKKNRKDMF